MLKTMPGTPGLLWAEADQAMGLKVIVDGMDVGIDMMQPIMLVTPQHLAAADHIEHTSHEPVDSFVVSIALVRPIVHDVETYQRTPLGQRTNSKYGDEERRGTKDQQ